MNKYTLAAISVIIIFVVSFSARLHAKQFKVLLITKVADWHHQSINEGVTALRKMSEEHYFELDWQEDTKRINDKYLQQFDVIIFLLTTGDILNHEQQSAMERFIQSGKGFVGVHSASDTERQWPWFQKLVGRSFITHPKIQTAKLKVESRNFPGLANMADQFLWTDEWHQYGDENVVGLKYLLTVDENTYDATVNGKLIQSNGMGSFHPIAWYHNFDGGRSFYTGLGHLAASYQNSLFLAHLYGGIYWAATGQGLTIKY